MQGWRVLGLWSSPGSWIYMASAGVVAAVGFAAESPWLIAFAALLTLPASIIAVPGYYLAYGLLALIPGANPSSSSGSGVAAPDGTVTFVTNGATATWFTTTTHALGVLAFVVAALANVALIRMQVARRRTSPAAVPSP